MALTGKSIIVHGRKLYEREDGWYQDDRGIVFDYTFGGKLYEQRQDGKWFWVRPEPEIRSDVGTDAFDAEF